MNSQVEKSQKRLFSYHQWAVIAVLLLAYGLMMSSALRKSSMVDEQSHLFRGVAYLQEGATHFLLGHPLFASSLSALPVLTEPNLNLPLEEPAWESGDWSVAGDAFLWRLNSNPQRIIFLGRLPVMWLTLLLLALIYRWGRELAGGFVGLLALIFLAFDPNLLANGRIISGDVPLTLFFTLTIYGYWRWSTRDAGWSGLLLAGVGLGLASVSKFNAGLLLPILGLLGLILARQKRSWQPLLRLLIVGVVGSLVIWGVNGFAIRPLPGGPFWDDLYWELQYFGKAHGSYLAGNYSTTGWWYYFPFAFIVKTPLPMLLLLAFSFVNLFIGRSARFRQDYIILLLPVVIYFGVSLTSSLNIGYRYLLPTLPFLWLFTAVSLYEIAPELKQPHRWIIRFAAIWLIVQAMIIWPNYIPFFNVLAGGDDSSWQLLSDSNIDWGQDLPALAAWQQESGQPVKLSYFGTAHPSAYDIVFEPLPMWSPAPEQALLGRQLYDPNNPSPGIYALSVTSLHGVVLGSQRDAFAWFRSQEPIARLGKSIHLYQVDSVGDGVDLVLAGLEPAQLEPEIREFFPGNELRVRWIDGRSAMLWPAEGGWLAISDAQMSNLDTRPFLENADLILQVNGQNLYQLPPNMQVEQTRQRFADVLTLFDVQSTLTPTSDKVEVVMVTRWQALNKNDRPLKLFIHALTEEGQILGQWDGLDIDPTSWQQGDQFEQLHQFSLPENESPHHLLIGVYDSETRDRLGEPLLIVID